MLHKSVLLKESIALLNLKKDGIYVDCTLGRAGHSSEILKNIPDGKLICFEQDQQAIDESYPKLAKIGKNFQIVKSNFKNIESELALLGIYKVDGILYDLGVSSPQLDENSRGFSYHSDAKLDMRMDQKNTLSAYDIVNEYSFSQLKYFLEKYGEEKFAKQIANQILKERSIKPIVTTLELVEIIKKALPQKALKKSGHPARKTFQALRIAVNDELNVLEQSISQALTLLNIDGSVVVISFHSLEDKIVKNLFKKVTTSPYQDVNRKLPIDIKWDAKYEIVNKKIIIPTQEELEFNNRSRSAKLRAIKKI